LLAAQGDKPCFELQALSHCSNLIILGHQHYQFLIRPTERRKARRPIFNRNSNRYAELTAFGDYA
jgi:hypothetical protein